MTTFLTSSVGRKVLMSLSGLGMIGFLITHLVANLLLYLPDGGLAYNRYAKTLRDVGPLLWFAEIGLLLIFAIHVYLALRLTRQNRAARGHRYAHSQKSKGGPSYLSTSSRNMIISGVILGAFIVLHVVHMKYGVFTSPRVNAMTMTIGGERGHDLYARVVDAFQNPMWVAIYMVVMLFLGAHLRHGFWSAFQSLGALNRRLEGPTVWLSRVTAVVFTVGFFFIPIWFFFSGSS